MVEGFFFHLCLLCWVKTSKGDALPTSPPAIIFVLLTSAPRSWSRTFQLPSATL